MKMEDSEKYCTRHETNKREMPIPFTNTIVYSCAQCCEEEEATEKKMREEANVIRNQSIIDNRLNNALIMPRFQDKTLDNFDAKGPSQTKALKTAMWFLENMDTCTGLIFIGKPGTGKNHLATGIVKRAILEYKKTALITEAIKIVRSIKESWGNQYEKESDVMKSYLLPDILVIDEIGVQFGTETESMYLTELINDRYNNNKPTIIMGNLKVNELTDQIGDRPVDRFREGGKVVLFDWGSYRAK